MIKTEPRDCDPIELTSGPSQPLPNFVPQPLNIPTVIPRPPPPQPQPPLLLPPDASANTVGAFGGSEGGVFENPFEGSFEAPLGHSAGVQQQQQDALSLRDDKGQSRLERLERPERPERPDRPDLGAAGGGGNAPPAIGQPPLPSLMQSGNLVTIGGAIGGPYGFYGHHSPRNGQEKGPMGLPHIGREQQQVGGRFFIIFFCSLDFFFYEYFISSFALTGDENFYCYL